MKVLQILFLIFGLFFAAAHSQTAEKSAEAVLSGTVYDEEGAVVPKAAIKLVGSDKKEFTAETNEDGIFEVNLFPGNYSVQVEAPADLPSFQIFKLEKYRIAKGKMNLDIVLEVRPFDDCSRISTESETIFEK